MAYLLIDINDIHCKICNRKFSRVCSISKHITQTRKISVTEYVNQYILKNNNPKCNTNKNLCLHHINEDKSDDDEYNLIYVCRSCHSVIHNSNSDKKVILNEKINQTMEIVKKWRI